MQALSDEHAQVKGSLRAEVVAKEVASRKLERVSSNSIDTVTVRHHCTLCVCLSVSLSLPLPLTLFLPSPVDFVSKWCLLSLFKVFWLSTCLVRLCWLGTNRVS